MTGALIAAGLKDAPDSGDVVVAPNGTAATVYFSAAAAGRVGAVAQFLAAQPWVGKVFAEEALAEVALPTATPLRIAVTLAADDRVNPHGVKGYGAIVLDPNDPESKIGFGQHGGLGANEQRPFLIVEGGGFARGERGQATALVDIAPTVLRHLHIAHDDMDGSALPLSA
jgi:hypothetical protein